MPKNKNREKGGRRKDRSRTIWDQFWLWIKVNEKVFWVVLLVLISFSFAFTGATMAYLNRRQIGSQPMLLVRGQPVTRQEFETAYRELELVRGRDVVDIYDYLLFQKEAERLGIRVSDEELGDAVRRIYWQYRAQEEASATANPQANWFAMQERLRELEEENAFDEKKWVEYLRAYLRIDHPVYFEEPLRRYLRALKVREYALKSVRVPVDEVFQEFLGKEKLLKLSFLEVKPGKEQEAEVAASITADDLKKYFDGHRDDFEPREVKMRVSYIAIPYKHFEGQVQVTDQQIESVYMRIRGERFRNGLAVDEGEFVLRTPEEQKEFESKLYKPLEEVKEQVTETLLKEESDRLAREFAMNLQRRLKPAPPPSAADPLPGTPPESAFPPATLEELAAEHSFLEARTSSWFRRWDAKEELGVGFAQNQVTNLFFNAEQNSREKDSKKRKTINAPDYPTPNDEQTHLLIYDGVQVRYPGDFITFEQAQDEVREAVIKQRALDRLEARADELVKAIREGGKSFEDAAADLGGKVHTTAYLKRSDSIMIPDEDAKEPETPAASPAEDSRPKTKYFPGSRLVLEEGLLIEKEGTAGEPVRDDANGAIYLVRLEGRLAPDPASFTDQYAIYHQRLLSDRGAHYYQNWLKDLWAEAEVKVYTRPVSENESSL